MKYEEKQDLGTIATRLGYSKSKSAFSRGITDFIINVFKSIDDYNPTISFNYSQVYKYYKNNSEKMPDFKKRIYALYLLEANENTLIDINTPLWTEIVLDLLESFDDKYIKLESLSKKQVIAFTKRYGSKMSPSSIRYLCDRFGFTDRSTLSISDLERVKKLLESLYDSKNFSIEPQKKGTTT